jgi:hypothetical protein
MTDNSLAPADTGANKESLFGRKEFHNFTVFRAQPLGGYPGSVIEHFNEARALKGKDPKFGKQLLLTNAQTECATGQILGLIVARAWLNDRLFAVR